MIDLREVREALTAALQGAGYNVSPGGDLVPEGATIGGFVVNYHRTVAGPATGLSVAGVEVRLATSRADEPSALERQDAAASTVWVELEAATGPWHALIVQTARPDAPLNVGDSTYQTLALVCELHV